MNESESYTPGYESESGGHEATCEILPLPFIYDEHDERIALTKDIIHTIADYCGYNLKTEENPEGDITYEELWKRIWLILRFISLATCWTDSIDDLFIMQTRTQQATAKELCGCRPNCCNCDADNIVIPLNYAPLLDDEKCMYVGGTISVVINGKVYRQDLTPEYLYQHTDPFTNKLYIMRDDFPDILYNHNRCCCLCKRQLTVTLRYNAGYQLLPKGLLPVICPLLAKIESAKLRTDNCAAAMTEVAGLLKRKKVGNVEYEWDTSGGAVDATTTRALITDLFDVSMLAEIQSISRCDDAMGVEEMGDVI